MALPFELRVNRQVIGEFGAVRREHKIPIDGVCTYDVTIITHANEYPRKPPSRRDLVIHHDYDAGAWELVRAALALLEEDE